MVPVVITYILVVIFGLAVGSFLNVIVLRFDEMETLWKVRSHCPRCKKEIKWYDLFPFFSYFALRAKCRNCKKTISYQYPVVEGFTALIFALIFWRFGFSGEAVLLAAISCFLILAATYDFIHYEIPDILTYLGLVLALVLIFVRLETLSALNFANLLPYVYAILVPVVLLGFLVLVSWGKWMGAGDILLGALMGAVLGYPDVFVGIFFAFVLGSIFGVLLLALRAKKLKDAVPFGPFLALGTFIALFFGTQLINFYFGFF